MAPRFEISDDDREWTWDALAGCLVRLTPTELAERAELDEWLADPRRNPHTFVWHDDRIGWVRAQAARQSRQLPRSKPT